MAVSLNAFQLKLIDIKYIINKNNEQYSDDSLSRQIWHLFLSKTQNYKTLNQKIKLRDNLFKILKPKLKMVNIYVSGSTVNGFATNDSDIDLCFIKDCYDFAFSKSNNNKNELLSKIDLILSQNNCISNGLSEIVGSIVPILRFKDSDTNIQVEININNEIAIRNTRLLYCYSKIDWRVSPICVAIKEWAKHTGCIDSYGGALSSYTIELMVIHYLQCCDPPVLPCLQKLYPDMFSPYRDISKYITLPELDQLLQFNSNNSQSLGLLMYGFFKYYLYEFSLELNVASVRLGHSFLRSQLSNNHRRIHSDWKYICVEEPYDLSNAARTLYDSHSYNRVMSAFQNMYDLLSDALV